MEQLRHRLTNVSPKGRRRSVDQNTLKRTDLDDLESPAVASHPLRVACYRPKNRHERKETYLRLQVSPAADIGQVAGHAPEASIIYRRRACMQRLIRPWIP